MIALLSDVHANLEALNAVVADLRHRHVKRIFFLGDIVGYGPNPAEVLDYIKDFEFCLLGNHDEACLKGAGENFNAAARRAIEWTRKQINPDEIPFFRPLLAKQRKEQWEYLQKLKPQRIVNDILFVHDTPAEPGSWKYVMRREDADAGFRAHPNLRAFFFGHSHQPAVWTEGGYTYPESGQRFDFTQRVMVNVGSVGQPRDKDPRACYVVLEPDGFRFFRVPYDIAKTQAKLRAIPELGEPMALRLEKGT